MSDPKNPHPLVTDLPQLQIVELEEPRVDRLQELADLVNWTTPIPSPKQPARCWN